MLLITSALMNDMLPYKRKSKPDCVWTHVDNVSKEGRINFNGVKGCIAPDLDCRQNVRNFIEKFQSEFLDACKMYQTGRMRNKLAIFCLPSDGRPIVLKRTSSVTPNLSWIRKIEILFKTIFGNYAQVAFRGSSALYLAGIQTPRPLAWWTQKTGKINKESYFLYEETQANETLSQKLKKIYMEKGESAEDEAGDLLNKMALITRKMHRANIIHGDIVTHNFLVRTSDGTLVLIDTDHVKPGYSFLPRQLKLYFDLRCLRRLDLSPEAQRYFLDKYFERQTSHLEWKIFRFWYLGGFSFRRWFKRLRKWSSGYRRTQPEGTPWWFPYK